MWNSNDTPGALSQRRLVLRLSCGYTGGCSVYSVCRLKVNVGINSLLYRNLVKCKVTQFTTTRKQFLLKAARFEKSRMLGKRETVYSVVWMLTSCSIFTLANQYSSTSTFLTPCCCPFEEKPSQTCHWWENRHSESFNHLRICLSCLIQCLSWTVVVHQHEHNDVYLIPYLCWHSVMNWADPRRRHPLVSHINQPQLWRDKLAPISTPPPADQRWFQTTILLDLQGKRVKRIIRSQRHDEIITHE